MSLSPLPLGYCTNVHPAQSVAEVLSGLDRYTTPVHHRLARPLAAGLWLARPVASELLATPDALPRFADALQERHLPCYTLNAFPFGNFHSPRVKENVYLPDWAHPDRLQYTTDCATILATLLPENTDGSISTVPLAFKSLPQPPGFLDASISQLLTLAERLHHLHQDTGRLVRLAIEPEPLCLLETTDEALAFFNALYQAADRANLSDAARTHLGLCYDVCHQAVEFEDVAASIHRLHSAGVRLNKIHISCAIEIQDPANNPDALSALSRYIEPRYLHQTIARTPQGALLRHLDLDNALVLNPPPPFANAPAWRIHFHVPVNADRLGPLHTTRPDLLNALRAVSQLPYAPHLEVETYTWEVLPDRPSPPDLVNGLTTELQATHQLLASISSH